MEREGKVRADERVKRREKVKLGKRWRENEQTRRKCELMPKER